MLGPRPGATTPVRTRLWRSRLLRERLPRGLRERITKRESTGAQNVSQAEVQQAVQRFAGRFADQVTQAAEQLADQGDLQHTERVLRRALLYTANAFEIATGPLPELNFLDMLVFTSLVRDAFAKHWQPRLFPSRGSAMLDALATAEADAWSLSEKYLQPNQRAELRERIRNWQATHPAQYRVESVRLSDFPELAAVGDRRSDKGTLLGDLRGATKTADQAVLLGDRALFWAQRAPTLIRLQVRLGALEITEDLTGPLAESQVLLENCGELVREAQALAPVLSQGTQLTQQLAQLSVQAQELL